MSRLVRACVVAILVLAVAAGVAYADATIYAAPPNQFFQGDVTIAQGEKVTFANGDTMTHDVTASGKGADGKPLFQSAQIGIGQSAPVEGVEFLTTGKYDYICSIHPFMTGSITVTSEGTPQKRPGDGKKGDSPAAGDTTAPTLSVKVLDTKKSKARKRRSLQLSIDTSEPADIAITATSGKTIVAKGKAKLNKAGTRKVTAKLTKAGLAMTKKSKRISITVTVDGKDAAGNSGSASASGKLR